MRSAEDGGDWDGSKRTHASMSTECHQLPARFALTASAMMASASNGTVFVTFADAHVTTFALNWARLLHDLRLHSLIGIHGQTVPVSTEHVAASAGASLFCADGPLMGSNGQAGRWAEVIPVLRLARTLQLSVLLSDADIAWINNPLPYFAAARQAHPRLDLLMMTDRAFNGYSHQPLRVQPSEVELRSTDVRANRATARGSTSTPRIALDLEPGYESAISVHVQPHARSRPCQHAHTAAHRSCHLPTAVQHWRHSVLRACHAKPRGNGRPFRHGGGWRWPRWQGPATAWRPAAGSVGSGPDQQTGAAGGHAARRRR